MEQANYPMIVEPLGAEDGGGYLAWVPALPGCISDGETPEEAVCNLQDAIAAWIDEAQATGRASRHPAHASQSLGPQIGAAMPRRSSRYFGPQQQQALLDPVRECRHACITGLTAAPVPGPHYLAIKRLMVAMDDLAKIADDQTLFHASCTQRPEQTRLVAHPR
jgi:predicted RNase H-like HicB family nuclease